MTMCPSAGDSPVSDALAASAGTTRSTRDLFIYIAPVCISSPPLRLDSGSKLVLPKWHIILFIFINIRQHNVDNQ